MQLVNNKKIVVVGSIAIDNTIFTKELPHAGTTTIADSYFQNIGGKGANQACAALFLGSEVSLIGAVGKDANGDAVKKFLKENGLNYRIKDSEKPTGVAFIILEESNAENRILIIQGSNNDLLIEDIEKNEDLFREGDILLTQFESPIPTIEYTIKKAKEKGMLVVVNPAPIKKVDDSIYQYIDYLVPNEHELEALSGETDVIKGANIMLDKGAKNIIATLGEKGSILVNKQEIIKVAPHKVEAIDTVAAGDSYLGALVNKMAIGANIKEAMEFASKCSSITVTRKGAIIALPHKEDLL